MTPRKGYTVRELKEAGICGPTKAYELLAEGKLKSILIGRKRVITAESVDALMEAA
jgi:hypothetical protein